MKPPSTTRRERLEAAGWTWVAGWMPPALRDDAAAALAAIEAHAADMEKVGRAPRRRGRPPKGGA